MNDAEFLANSMYESHRFGDAAAWFNACVRMAEKLLGIEAERATLKGQLADEALAFNHANEIVAKLEAELAAVTADRDRWQQMHENALKEARLAEAERDQLRAVSCTYGELPEVIRERIDNYIWDNKNPSQQRDWLKDQLDGEIVSCREQAAQLAALRITLTTQLNEALAEARDLRNQYEAK